MNPRSRRKWTPKEDSTLQFEVGFYQNSSASIPWTDISTKLPGRNNKDCRKRWFKMAASYKKGPWTDEEDQRLLQAIGTFGTRWNQVTQHVATRNADQCAKRWQHSLDPSIDRSPWVTQDDEDLLKAVMEYGRAWRTIASNKFPLRSPTDLKNRYELICRRLHDSRDIQASNQAQHTLPDLDELMDPNAFCQNMANFSSVADHSGILTPNCPHIFDPHNLMDMENSQKTTSYSSSDPGVGELSLPLTPESDFRQVPQRSIPTQASHDNHPFDDRANPSSKYNMIIENIDPASVGDLMHFLVKSGLILDIRLQRQTKQ